MRPSEIPLAPHGAFFNLRFGGFALIYLNHMDEYPPLNTTPVLQPEPASVPKKRFGAKYALLIILFFAGAAAGYFFLIKNKTLAPTEPQITPSAATTTPSSAVAGKAIRGVSGDLWADLVIGKPSFAEITPFEVVPNKMFNPGGILVDRDSAPSGDPGYAYAYDIGNSRILGFDLGKCYATKGPCSADLVLGQPSTSDHSACNGDSSYQSYPVRVSSTAATLCGMPESQLSTWEFNVAGLAMSSDKNGNLYAPDLSNNRVLFYQNPFKSDLKTAEPATEVWGQPDFNSNLCNLTGHITAPGSPTPTAFSLCEPQGTVLDAKENLWVVDSGNHRVLRFPKDAAGKISKTADLVLGQPSLTTGCYDCHGTGLDQMFYPNSMAFDEAGNIYVADRMNNRVLVFNQPITSGMKGRIFNSEYSSQSGVLTDQKNRGLWVQYRDPGDHPHEILWSWDGAKQIASFNSSLAAGGIGLDRQGSILVAGYNIDTGLPGMGIDDVSVTAPQKDSSYKVARYFFYPPGGNSTNQAGKKGLAGGSGVVTTKDQFIVADYSRILFWNKPASELTTFAPADGVLEAPDFNTINIWSGCCGRIRADKGGHLWVLDRFSGEIRAYQLPITADSKPIKKINYSLPALGGGSVDIKGSPGGSFGANDYNSGIAPVGNGDYIWVSHQSSHRVFRIRNPLSDNPQVDVILGQKNLKDMQCNIGLIPGQNRGADKGQIPDGSMICSPGDVTLDRLGNVYVSDNGMETEGNWRLLEFDAKLFPTNNKSVIFDPMASKIFPYQSKQPGVILEPAFDSKNRMIGGYNVYLGGEKANFVGVYTNPLGTSTDPDYYLNDFYSLALTTTFDDEDNLYVADPNRGRILIYKTPLVNLPTP